VLKSENNFQSVSVNNEAFFRVLYILKRCGFHFIEKLEGSRSAGRLRCR
jgi:hypothetical protein